MYVPELDIAFYTLNLLTVIALAINFWCQFKESLDTSSSMMSFGKIRYVAEDSPCRLRAENDGAVTQEELEPESKD